MDQKSNLEKQLDHAADITPNLVEIDGALPKDYWDGWLTVLREENKARLLKCEDDLFNFLNLDSVEYIFTACLRMRVPGEIRYLAALYFDCYMRKQTRSLFNFVAKTGESVEKKDKEWAQIEANLQSQIPLRICSCIQLASKEIQYHTSLTPKDIVSALKALGHHYTLQVVVDSERRIVQTLNFNLPKSPIVYPESILKILSRHSLEELGIDRELDMQKCWDYILLLMDLFFLYHDRYARILLQKSCPKIEFDKIPQKLVASLKSDYCLLGGGIALAAVHIVHNSTAVEAILPAVSRISGVPSDDLSDAVMTLLSIGDS